MAKRLLMTMLPIGLLLATLAACWVLREDSQTARLNRLLYQVRFSANRIQAEAEVRDLLAHERTNAVPPLLVLLQRDDSPSKVRNVGKSLAQRLPILLRSDTYVAWAWADTRRTQVGAMVPWAFAILGSNAAPALPELERLSQQTNNAGTHARIAVAALAWLRSAE